MNKIILIIFSLMNLLILLWATNILNYFNPNISEFMDNEFPVIEAENKIIKEKPKEFELFPHSDSSLWSAFENLSDEKENVDIDVSSESNNEINFTEKNSSIEILKKNDKENNQSSTLENKNKQNEEKEITENVVENKNNIEEKSKTKIDKYLSKENKTNRKFFYIQVASVSKENLVDIEWKRLLKIYPELSLKTYEYKKIQLNNGNIFYRILVGPFEKKKETKNFCNDILKIKKCIVSTYE